MIIRKQILTAAIPMNSVKKKFSVNPGVSKIKFLSVILALTITVASLPTKAQDLSIRSLLPDQINPVKIEEFYMAYLHDGAYQADGNVFGMGYFPDNTIKILFDSGRLVTFTTDFSNAVNDSFIEPGSRGVVSVPPSMFGADFATVTTNNVIQFYRGKQIVHQLTPQTNIFHLCSTDLLGQSLVGLTYYWTPDSYLVKAMHRINVSDGSIETYPCGDFFVYFADMKPPYRDTLIYRQSLCPLDTQGNVIEPVPYDPYVPFGANLFITFTKDGKCILGGDHVKIYDFSAFTAFLNFRGDTPPPVNADLKLSRESTNVTISWSTNFPAQIESSTRLEKPFSPLPAELLMKNGRYCITLPMTNDWAFFRLRCN
jgi:hypothetical protein